MRRRQANGNSPELLYFPTYIFRDRSIAVLEALVAYAKDKGLSYHEIGRLLNRDERTVWTTYSRVQKKR